MDMSNATSFLGHGQLAEACRLARLGPRLDISPAMRELFFAAERHIAEGGGPMDDDERRVCEIAGRLRDHVPPPEPTPPISAELARRIAEAGDVLQARQLAADAALEALVSARQRVQLARDAGERGRREADAVRAAEEHKVAREGAERARAALNALHLRQ
jgi:hypothetical protein